MMGHVQPACGPLSVAYTGDVTALRVEPLDDGSSLVLVGNGSQLHAYSLPSGQLLLCQTVLPYGVRVHGVSAIRVPGQARSSPGRLLLAVHGDRHVNVLLLDLGALSLAPVCQLPHFNDWTVAAHISLPSGAAAAGGSSTRGTALLAVGLSDNSVEVFRLEVHLPSQNDTLATAGDSSGSAAAAVRPPVSRGTAGGSWAAAAAQRVQRVLRAESAERCLLFSMALHQQLQPDGCVVYLVASGTIFLDVVIWATPAITQLGLAAPAALESAAAAAETAPTVFRLKGHTGLIQRVRWFPDASLLASMSDDRTLHVWDIPPTAGAAGTAQRAAAATQLLQPRHVLFGHTARLWDCAWGQGWLEGLVVTASEDCSCKVWELGSGQLVATIKGHRGRGVWQCALHGCLLLTAGSDSSVKIWNLPDWLPPGIVPPLAPSARDAPPAASARPRAVAAVAVSGGSGAGCEDAAFLGGQLAESFELLLDLPNPEGCTMGRTAAAEHRPAARAPGKQQAVQSGAAEAQLQQSQEQLASAVGAEGGTDVVAGASRDGGGRGGSNKGGSKAKRRKGQAIDSKDECVKYLAMGSQGEVYVATARGLLHRVQLPSDDCPWERWEALYVSPTPCAFASLAVEREGPEWHWVGGCNHIGQAVALRVPAAAAAGTKHNGTAAGEGRQGLRAVSGVQQWEWKPYGGRTVLGVFPAPQLGAGLVFTAGLEGTLTLWALGPGTPPSQHAQQQQHRQHRQQAQVEAGGALPGGGEAPGTPDCCPAVDSVGIREPVRLAEVQSPKRVRIVAIDAWLCPGLVVAGDQDGNVAAWALDALALRQLQQCAWRTGQGAACPGAEAAAAAAGGGALAAEQGEGAANEQQVPGRQLLKLLAATTHVHGHMPVRMLRIGRRAAAPLFAGPSLAAESAAGAALATGQPAEQGQQRQQQQLGLNDVHIVTGGGNARVKWLGLEPSPGRPGAAGAAGAGSEGAMVLACIRDDHTDSVTAPSTGGFSAGGWEVAAAAAQQEEQQEAAAAAGVLHGFQASNYVVFATGHDCEVVRVPCGGWRRPCAAVALGPDSLTFCYVKDGRIHVYRRRSPPGIDLAALPPRSLHPPHHSKEQHVIALLQPPATATATATASAGPGNPQQLLACLTGGEDGSIRQLLAPSSNGSGCAGGVFSGAGLLGEHTFGTAVRAISLIPTSPGCWVLVSGGAKEVLTHWQLRWQDSGSLLGCELISTRPLPRRGPKQGRPLTDAELRVMAVSAFMLPPSSAAGPPAADPASAGVVFAAVASSDASMVLEACHLAQRGQQAARHAWRRVAALQQLRSLVLCTAHVELPTAAAATSGATGGSGASCGRHLLLSGATDGSLTVWDLTAAAEQYTQHYNRDGSGGSGSSSLSNGGGASPATAGGEEWQALELEPLLTVEGVHQSGVNDMAAALLGPDTLFIVTGGDDQALSATLLHVPQGSSPPVLLARLCLPNAHSSAIRGVWTNGGVAFSVGLDQRVRAWRLGVTAPEGMPAAAAATVAAQPAVFASGGSGGDCSVESRVAQGPGLVVGMEPGEGAGSDSGSLLDELEAFEAMEMGAAQLGGSNCERGEGSSSGAGPSGWRLEVQEVGCQITQALEPAAIDVVAVEGGEGMLGVAVAGRGTELLRWQL